MCGVDRRLLLPLLRDRTNSQASTNRIGLGLPIADRAWMKTCRMSHRVAQRAVEFWLPTGHSTKLKVQKFQVKPGHW
jgi:hypothetical protein